MESPENKTNKPQDNVLTPDQTPSYSFGITLVLVILAISLFIAALYFGILKI